MKLDEEIQEWAQGKWPGAKLPEKYRKLGEEQGELGEALINLADIWARTTDGSLLRGPAKYAALKETADCAIVLSQIARMLGADGLMEVMELKFRELKVRDELVEHCIHGNTIANGCPSCT